MRFSAPPPFIKCAGCVRCAVAVCISALHAPAPAHILPPAYKNGVGGVTWKMSGRTAPYSPRAGAHLASFSASLALFAICASIICGCAAILPCTYHNRRLASPAHRVIKRRGSIRIDHLACAPHVCHFSFLVHSLRWFTLPLHAAPRSHSLWFSSQPFFARSLHMDSLLGFCAVLQTGFGSADEHQVVSTFLRHGIRFSFHFCSGCAHRCPAPLWICFLSAFCTSSLPRFLRTLAHLQFYMYAAGFFGFLHTRTSPSHRLIICRQQRFAAAKHRRRALSPLCGSARIRVAPLLPVLLVCRTRSRTSRRLAAVHNRRGLVPSCTLCWTASPRLWRTCAAHAS